MSTMLKDIPSKYRELIPKIAEKIGTTDDEIRNTLLMHHTELIDSNLNIDKKRLWEASWKKTIADLSKVFGSTRSPAMVKYVFVIGESGIQDGMFRWRKRAEEAGMIIDGVMHDPRELVYGRKNDNYGQPVKPEWEREIFVVASDTQDFEKCEVAVLKARGEVAQSLSGTFKGWGYYKVRVGIPKTTKKMNKDIRNSYNLTMASRFLTIQPMIEQEEILTKINFIDIFELSEYVEKFKDKKPFEQPIFAVRGNVSRVQRQPREEFDTRLINITDDEMNVAVVSLPKIIPFMYEEGTEVVFFGSVSIDKNSNYKIRAVGYMLGGLVFEYQAP
jgi:hypothetical protein